MKIMLVVLAVMISSCVSYGNKIDRDYTNEITKGVTTEAQILQVLGKPISVGQNSSGMKTLTYMHVASQAKAASYVPIVGLFAGGADSQTTMLIITVDASTGVVSDWNYNESNSEVNTGILAN
jgi:outer membrane protein assembly factor BamE (lipoprotein component of BamABCDE complex)